MKDIVLDLRKKFAGKPTEFAAAMTILGNNPELSLAAVELQMITEQLATVQASLATITAERDTLCASLATRDRELVTVRAEFAALKASGHAGVNLAAPASPASSGTSAASGDPLAAGVNPWAKETRNLTQQAIILKTDPARAAALMRAAGVKA